MGIRIQKNKFQWRQRERIRNRKSYDIVRRITSRFNSRVLQYTSTAVLIFISILLITYVLFISPVFLLRNIEIQPGNEAYDEQIRQLVEEQFSKKRYYFFKQNNYFFYSIPDAKTKIMSMPVIDDVEISKRLLKTLKISLAYKEPAMTWITKGNYYYLDSKGQAIESLLVPTVTLKTVEATDPETNNVPEQEQKDSTVFTDDTALNKTLPMVIDESNNEIGVGDYALTDSKVRFIRELSHGLKDITSAEITHFKILLTGSSSLHAIHKKGYYIIFQMEHDVKRQLANYELIIREKISKMTTTLEYIDLRDESGVVYIK